MSGKLPIDRAREGENAPRIYEDNKRRFTEKQAKLRDLSSIPADNQNVPSEDASKDGDGA